MQDEALQKQIKTALSIHNAALHKMRENNIALIPENYAIWYEYTAGNNKDLIAAIDKLISSKTVFSITLNHHLATTYISSDQSSGVLDNIQEETKELIDGLFVNIQEMRQGTMQFSEVLNKYNKILANEPNIETLKNLISSLIEEASKVELSTSALGYTLDTTSKEVDLLKSDFCSSSEVILVDKLTKIANRRAFEEAVVALISHYRAEEEIFSLVRVNIDYFKELNNTFGRSVGDKVLIYIANALRQGIKGQDIVARYGNDDFAILLPCTNYDGAIAVAEGLRSRLAHKRLTVGGEQKKTLGNITASFSVALIETDDDSISIVERANRALSLAKEKGRNCVVGERELFSRLR